jgi:hypothetical protein
MDASPRFTLALAFLTVLAKSQADPYYVENFDTCTNGALVGQGSWMQTGSASTNPIQVQDGWASLAGSGQDANTALFEPVELFDSDTLYIGLKLNISSAEPSGDYFLHITPNPGDTTSFFQRLFAHADEKGFLLGYQETSGAEMVPTYGVWPLQYGTTYRVVLVYNSNPGDKNDSAGIYINPANTESERANIPYLWDYWSSSAAENHTIGSINLRQGGSSAATLRVDDLIVSRNFAEASGAAAVPEPRNLFLLSAIVLLSRELATRQRHRLTP